MTEEEIDPREYLKLAMNRISTEDKRVLAEAWIRRCMQHYLIPFMEKRALEMPAHILRAGLGTVVPQDEGLFWLNSQLEEISTQLEAEKDVEAAVRYLLKACEIAISDRIHLGSITRFVVVAIRRAAPAINFDRSQWDNRPKGTVEWLSSLVMQKAVAKEHLEQALEIASLLPLREKGSFEPIRLDSGLGMPKN
jgi:hypothetical protein